MRQEDIGAFMAELRKEQGWTQKEMASRLGVSDKAVSKWETGKSLPDMGILIPLSDLLDITVDELLSGKKKDRNVIEGNQNEPNKIVIEYAVRTIERVKKHYRLIPVIILSIFILGIFVLSGLGYSFGSNTKVESPLTDIVERNSINTIGMPVMTEEEKALLNFAQGAGTITNYLAYRFSDNKKLAALGIEVYDGEKWTSEPIITNGESHMGMVSFSVNDGTAKIGLHEADGYASYLAERRLAGFSKSWDQGTVSIDETAEVSNPGKMMLSAWIAQVGDGMVSIDILGKNEEEWKAYRSTMEEYRYVVALYVVVE